MVDQCMSGCDTSATEADLIVGVAFIMCRTDVYKIMICFSHAITNHIKPTYSPDFLSSAHG